MKRRHPSWKLWIRLSGSGEPIAGSDQWRKKKPSGNWVDITNCARQCCVYHGELVQLLVIPTEGEVEELLTYQLTVIAVYDNGNVVNVTNDATYTSDDTNVATVSDTGLVTGVDDGSTTIDVSFGGETTTVNVDVIDPTLTGLRFEPVPDTDWEVEDGNTLQVTVYAVYSNGTEVDVTSTATYSVDDTNIATMVAGLITSVTPGTTDVDITFGGETETINITVTA